MEKITDQSKMTFGKYKGTAIEDVPASYLIWIYDNKKCPKNYMEYIKDNLDELYQELKE